jgi:hypothetical protein
MVEVKLNNKIYTVSNPMFHLRNDREDKKFYIRNGCYESAIKNGIVDINAIANLYIGEKTRFSNTSGWGSVSGKSKTGWRISVVEDHA